MYTTIFRTFYKNLIDNQQIERLVSRYNMAFEKTTSDVGLRYKIIADKEETLETFKKNLRSIYPQIPLV